MLGDTHTITSTNPPQELAAKSFNGVKSKSPSFLPLTAPFSIDNRQTDNHCLFLNRNYCENKINSTSNFVRACIIRDLSARVDSEAKNIASSPCANNFFFYYETLSQMSNTATKLWVKYPDAHKNWAIIEKGNNDMTACHEHTVGKKPEVVPLDASLSNDLDGGVERHITCTSQLTHDDLRKFSLFIPS